MKTMNFYTQNGWAGSNYDSKLSTKGIAAKVRSYAKKNFPEFKFSIRTEWSMYTDSMYIELKEGTCIPFVEGSRSAERGYMNTMNTVKGWEKELTPEMFKALDAVTVYANSFKYDDSDSMQDYFDTNFYLNIKISEEYKVIEPKVKKSSVKPEKVEEAKGMGAVTVEGLEIVDYSEKAIVVFGDTKAIKEQLKELGGRFNPALNHNGEKRAGWIFSKKQADKVRALLAPSAEPESVSLPELPKEITESKTVEADTAETNAKIFEQSDNFFKIVKRLRENVKKGHSENTIKKNIKSLYNLKHDEFFRVVTVPYFSKHPSIPRVNKEVVFEFLRRVDKLTKGDNVENDLSKISRFSSIYNTCEEINKELNEPTQPIEAKSGQTAELIEFAKASKEADEITEEAYPLENIHFTETGSFNGVCYYDIEGAGIITGAKVCEDIQPGDVFNVYTDKERKHGVTYDGVSLNRSLYNALPGIIKFDNKIEVGILSISSHYKPMVENVEFYEKKVKGMRYTIKDKPSTLGYYGILDNLDNCIIDCFQTKEEAEKEAEILNAHVDKNGRLRSVI